MKIIKHLNNPLEAMRIIRNNILAKPRRCRMCHYFLKLFSTYKKPKKWVFIVGCYNSGTSLLRNILASHEDISGIPTEGAFFTEVLKIPEEFGWIRMWHKVKDQIAVKDDTLADKVKKDWSVFLNKSKKIYLEKSIVNSLNIEWLNKNFKNSHFIFLVRNGFSVSEGIQRKVQNTENWEKKFTNKDGTYPIELCAEQWVENNKIIEGQLKNIEKVYRLKYEDFTENPQKYLSEIFKFIGVKTDKEFYNKSWYTHGVKSKIKNMNKKSFKNLNNTQIKKIKEIAVEYLKKYDYFDLK